MRSFFLVFLFVLVASLPTIQALATLLLIALLTVLISSHLPSLLDGIRHHFLFFESLSDVVTIET